MANKVTLKNSTNEIIYPQTLVDSVQDESGAMLKTLVLMRNNQDAFIPTENYQPATKKYVDDKAKSTITYATLLASAWDTSGDHPKYTLSVSGVTPDSNQEILPPANPSDEVMSALMAANLQDGGQADDVIYIIAYGNTPTINIPIRVILRGCEPIDMPSDSGDMNSSIYDPQGKFQDIFTYADTKQAKITASGILKGDGAGGVSAAVKGTDYAEPSVGVTATLTAAGWDADAKTQAVSVARVTETANGSLRIAQSATDEQFTAWGAAQPRVTAQAAGTLTVKAAGTLPTIDIPVEVLIV